MVERGNCLTMRLLLVGVMEKLGLGPDELLQENPRLIYARLTGYGETGPFANFAGYNLSALLLLIPPSPYLRKFL